jgi:hypothetical protein
MEGDEAMSEHSPDWQNKVKQGLFAEVIFTNDMKKSVLEAVDRNPSYFFRKWKRFAGAAVICMTAAILLINWSQHEKEKTAASVLPVITGGEVGLDLPVTFKLLAARNWVRGEVIHDNDPDILPGLSNKYNPLRDKNNGYISQIPLSDIELIENREINGFGTAMHYKLKADSVAQHDIDRNADYFGFTVDGLSQEGTLFDYGVGHMYDAQFSMTRLFGQEVLKIKLPICRTDGEACVFYLKKDAEGIVTYISFDAASYEQDLDGDGSEEAVVVTHKQNQIYLFKEQDGQLLWASVRETLKAGKEDIIQYDNDRGIFIIRSTNAGEKDSVSAYRYAEGENDLVRIEN